MNPPPPTSGTAASPVAVVPGSRLADLRALWADCEARAMRTRR